MPSSQLTVTKVVDGSRIAVLHAYIKGDGSGELVNEVLADPSILVPGVGSKPCFAIMEVEYEFSGFDVRLAFDSTPDLSAWNLASAASSNKISFRHIGGLVDRGGNDGTGKLLLSTKGLVNGSHGSLVISLKKRSQN